MSYQVDDAEVALEKALPGMYGLDSLGAVVHGSAVSISAAADCAFVLEVISAGQWRIEDLQQASESNPTITAVLSFGDRTAALSLSLAAADHCSGNIVLPVDAALTISGAVHEAGPAQMFPLRCVSIDGEGGLVELGYLTKHGGYLVGAEVPATVGSATFTGTDAGFMLYQASADSPDLGSVIAALRTATSSGFSQSDDGAIPGWRRAGTFTAGTDTTETVTVTALSPLAGTVTISKAMNLAAKSQAVTMSAAFTCVE